MDSLYLVEAITEGQIPSGVDLLTIESEGIRMHKLSVVFLVLGWTAVFAVKFSFLFFFRALTSRVRHMEFLWRGVVAMTIIAWLACCITSVTGCPYFDERGSM